MNDISRNPDDNNPSVSIYLCKHRPLFPYCQKPPPFLFNKQANQPFSLNVDNDYFIVGGFKGLIHDQQIVLKNSELNHAIIRGMDKNG